MKILGFRRVCLLFLENLTFDVVRKRLLAFSVRISCPVSLGILSGGSLKANFLIARISSFQMFRFSIRQFLILLLVKEIKRKKSFRYLE